MSKCCMVSLSNLTPILWGLCLLAKSEKSWNGPVGSVFYSWELNASLMRLDNTQNWFHLGNIALDKQQNGMFKVILLLTISRY